ADLLDEELSGGPAVYGLEDTESPPAPLPQLPSPKKRKKRSRATGGQIPIGKALLYGWGFIGIIAILSIVLSAHLDAVFSEFRGRGKSVAVVFWR
ncbi:MAG TPA: hypothetical protein VE890_09400, partial [Thermoguttaceae bacterium]|nr:hypothetical protein [Thermoguttaceae bacterium]